MNILLAEAWNGGILTSLLVGHSMFKEDSLNWIA